MTGDSANHWPVRQIRTLANLQDQVSQRMPLRQHFDEAAQKRRGGEPAATTPWSRTRYTASNRLSVSLSNHRHHILRHGIKRGHRLRVRLERPLRHNQIRKLC